METEEIVRCYGTMRGEIMGENRKIYAALLGAGTVGSGVYKLAGMQEEDICLKTGAHLEIKKILVRNPGKVREGIPAGRKFWKTPKSRSSSKSWVASSLPELMWKKP